MISFPSKKNFRLQLILGLVIYLLMEIGMYYGYDIPDQDVADLISFNNYGSVISLEKGWLLYQLVLIINIIGLIGMICFCGWGRFLIIGGYIVNLLTVSFLGLIVTTGIMTMLWMLVQLLVGIPLVLSFFDPCSKYFESNDEK